MLRASGPVLALALLSACAGDGGLGHPLPNSSLYPEIAIAPPPPPSATPPTECDRLAADPADSMKAPGVAGVPYKKIKAAPAIAACERALRDHPVETRFQFQLARSYEQAGRARDAAEPYRKAADAGHPGAMKALGAYHQLGFGAPQSDRQAMQWYVRAIEAGHVGAMNSLGLLYMDGRGVAQDDRNGARWIERAAQGGDPWGMYNLGVYLQAGQGLPKDPVAAMQWFFRAAETGNPAVERLAAERIGYNYHAGRGTAPNRAQAFRWYMRAAELDNADAMRNLGMLHYYGDGKPGSRNYNEAMAWFRKSAPRFPRDD